MKVTKENETEEFTFLSLVPLASFVVKDPRGHRQIPWGYEVRALKCEPQQLRALFKP